jgi:hypothetical protein
MLRNLNPVSGRYSRSGVSIALPSLLLLAAILATTADAGAAARSLAGSAAPGLATSATEPVLVEELTTETSTTLLQPDGSYSLTAFTTPINYRDDSGEWREIDNTLVEAPGATYAVENAANAYTALIPEDASTTPVKFAIDDAWATMRMHGADDAPAVEGAEASFDDVIDTDGVTYEATATGLKETIHLDSVPDPAAGPLEYTFTMDASEGMTPVLTEEGGVDFVDGAGHARISIPVGNMTDSATPEPAFTEDVTYALAQAGDKWTLTVTPDAAWLADPARAYPVRIDPTLTDQTAIRDCWLEEAVPTNSRCGGASPYIRVGRVAAGERRRGLLDFDISSIPATASVTEAAVNLYLDASQSLNGQVDDYVVRSAGKPFNNYATWNSSGADGSWTGGSPTGPDYGARGIYGTDSGWKSFTGLEELIQGWHNGAEAHTGLLLKQAGEDTNNALGFFSSASGNPANRHPYLAVSYMIPDTPDDAEAEPPAPAMTAYGVDEYVLEDIQVVAQEEGITLQQALDLYGWQDTFAEDIDQIASAYPESFAWAEMNPNGTPGALVKFKAAVPAGAANVTSDLPVPVTLSAGAAHTETEVADLVVAAHDSVAAAVGPDGQAETSYNQQTERVEALVYSPVSPPSAPTVGTNARQAIAQQMPEITLPDVDVTVSTDPLLETETLRGGVRLRDRKLPNGNFDTCTSGFSVKVIEGEGNADERGLLTARHCENDLIYYSALTSTERFRLADADRFLPMNQGDIQYHRGLREKVGPSFYYAVGKYRAVTKRVKPRTGMRACLFGRKTEGTYDGKRTCTEVDDLGVSAKYGSQDYDGLARTDRRVSRTGDSGGPWFWGGGAIGIHSGSGDRLLDNDGWSYFTPIYGRVAEEMGLLVMTIE